MTTTTKFSDHWSYYDDIQPWPQSDLRPTEQFTVSTFRRIGIPNDLALKLWRSGFVVLEIYPDIVIDRFHGGALASSDMRTRIRVDQFKDWLERGQRFAAEANSLVQVTRATSYPELLAHVEKIASSPSRDLLFRGQTANYALNREINNPYLIAHGYGEVSLMPGIWRKAHQTQPNTFHDFIGLGLLDWSEIIYSQFDIPEIDRRVEAARLNGEWIYSAQDMEDSDDPLLHDFGRTRLDLMMEYSNNLADLLNTLLQHYGLLSPYLDLSTDLRTALFFATHKLNTTNDLRKYDYIGTRKGSSVLYVFTKNQTEMHSYASHRVLGRLEPLRPTRQSCVVCRTAPLATNLPADFLRAMIFLDFELPENTRIESQTLLPPHTEDNFLHALLENTKRPREITNFVYPASAAT